MTIKNIIKSLLIVILMYTLISLSVYQFLYSVSVLAPIAVYLLIATSLIFALFSMFRFWTATLIVLLSLSLSLYSSPTFRIINNIKIFVSSGEELPNSGEIIKWGGNGTFQSDYFFYLLKMEEVNTADLESNIKKNANFSYLINDRCRLNLDRLNRNYLLIGSNC
ncbi:hypothetical protein PsAD2_02862 [Pseudovibrio axinellae]|uniref:DUF4131 domain-containing protein n=1 Tax=Pseudovibrio axinellae TaxID=989403 RepID=A0A165XN84_9HYPH|nr:hypothetical protein [Pseudovibrio axinellae]KZL17880.1 hypothetical protein PsAD2_02862 [Pseudovibrio axinellae]SER94750.1 hypothetical protein SAMN05421798_1771 [Pseudovibrio axinellae]